MDQGADPGHDHDHQGREGIKEKAPVDLQIPGPTVHIQDAITC